MLGLGRDRLQGSQSWFKTKLLGRLTFLLVGPVYGILGLKLRPIRKEELGEALGPLCFEIGPIKVLGIEWAAAFKEKGRKERRLINQKFIEQFDTKVFCFLCSGPNYCLTRTRKL
ncbi:hypothetical protein Droror1_Dr00012258 [Drosera rotundifolia]